MLGFSTKKAFFDIWDHMFVVMLLNLPYAVLIGAFYFICGYLDTALVFSLIGLFIVVLMASVYGAVVNSLAFRFTKYEKRMVSVLSDLRHRLLHSVFCAFVYSLVLFLCFYGIPAYLSLNSVISVAIGMLLVWCVLFVLLAMQYYYPLSYYAPGDNPVETLKRCCQFVLNNFGWSIFLAFKNLVALVFSVLTGMVIPGPVGISVSRMATTRLTVITYEYLRDNPDQEKRYLNWSDVFFAEEEALGKRDLMSMVFPRR